MKKILAYITILSVFISCKKEKDTPPNQDTTMGTVIKQGTFTSANGYMVSGIAKVIDSSGKRYLRFENFNSSNGPSLRVYLATDNNATQFTDLGVLKSTSGNQVYEIMGTTNININNHALIWCRQVNRLFGAAQLQ